MGHNWGYDRVWSPGKSESVLKEFWESSHLENLICSCGISFSWKILVLFWRNFGQDLLKNLIRSYNIFPPGNLYVFLRNFEKAFLEILMCSSTLCLSWKISCVLIKELCLLLKNSYVFLLHPSLLKNLMRFRNLFKKVTLGKKEQIF